MNWNWNANANSNSNSNSIGDSSLTTTTTVSQIVSTLAAMGLFVTTAAVSQWIQNQHRRQRERERERDEEERELRLLRAWRQQQMQQQQQQQQQKGRPDPVVRAVSTPHRREDRIQAEKRLAFEHRMLSRRLSFSYELDSGSGIGSGSGSSDDEVQKKSKTPPRKHSWDDRPQSEWSRSIHGEDRGEDRGGGGGGSNTHGSLAFPRESRSLRPCPGASHGEILESRASASGANQRRWSSIRDRYHDFHPKYQNWRHFEHCNEHDRARQRSREQIAMQLQHQQQQQQQQQYIEQSDSQQRHHTQHHTQQHTQQEAGEVPSQSRDDKTPTKNPDSVMDLENRRDTAGASANDHRNPLHRPSLDNGSDQESASTFAGDDQDDSTNNDRRRVKDQRSNGVLGPGEKHFVWTAGGHASNYHRQLSSKSDCLLVSGTDDSESSFSSSFPSSPKSRPRDPGTPPLPLSLSLSPTMNSQRNTNAPTNDDNQDDLNHQMGKFERFYRMLKNGVVDDDSQTLTMQIEPPHEPPIRIPPPSRTCSSGTVTSSSTSDEYCDDLHPMDGEDIEDRHRALRTEYNAQIMPEKLVLIRHGQSLGNVDERVYATTPDNAMPITDLGWEQARKAGRILKDKILNPNESVHFMVSPYVRTVETFHGIVSAWCDPESPEFASIQDHNRRVDAWYQRLTELGLTWNEDPRIREQDFGNYQNPEATKRAKEERHRFGAFYYRFNNGESGSDVFDRVSTFLDSLWRSFETNKSQNYVLVTHGIVLRVLMARYFRYTIGQLNMLANPRNCEMVVLGHAGDGRLDLEGRCALELETANEQEHEHQHEHEHEYPQRKKVCGYRFHRRMRILPKSLIRTVRFRISPNDSSRSALAAAKPNAKTKAKAKANPKSKRSTEAKKAAAATVTTTTTTTTQVLGGRF